MHKKEKPAMLLAGFLNVSRNVQNYYFHGTLLIRSSLNGGNMAIWIKSLFYAVNAFVVAVLITAVIRMLFETIGYSARLPVLAIILFGHISWILTPSINQWWRKSEYQKIFMVIAMIGSVFLLALCNAYKWENVLIATIFFFLAVVIAWYQYIVTKESQILINKKAGE